jgi:hypothetical protein
VRSPVEIKKSKSRAGGTAGAAVHPKTTDPTSWEVGFFAFFFAQKKVVFGVLCVSHSQQGEFQNTTRGSLGEVHARSLWPKKIRGKFSFPVVFPLRFF